MDATVRNVSDTILSMKLLKEQQNKENRKKTYKYLKNI